MLQFIGNLVSPAGNRGRLSILIYHRVLAHPDPILNEIDVATFEGHMNLLAAEFNVLPLSEGCHRLACGRLPSRAVCITFDDGYADNEEVALPILERLHLPATFFISTGFSAGDVMFNDGIIDAVRRARAGVHDFSKLGFGEISFSDAVSRRATVDVLIEAFKYRPLTERTAAVEALSRTLEVTPLRNLMMTPSQIAKVHRAGMEIGAHTVNHPILQSISDEEARTEIIVGKRTLEEITGSPVTVFAYPNGKPGRDYGSQHVRLVREAGFAAAVSTITGVAHCGSDPFELPRFSPWERNPRRLALRLLLSCARTPPARSAKSTRCGSRVQRPDT